MRVQTGRMRGERGGGGTWSRQTDSISQSGVSVWTDRHRVNTLWDVSADTVDFIDHCDRKRAEISQTSTPHLGWAKSFDRFEPEYKISDVRWCSELIIQLCVTKQTSQTWPSSPTESLNVRNASGWTPKLFLLEVAEWRVEFETEGKLTVELHHKSADWPHQSERWDSQLYQLTALQQSVMQSHRRTERSTSCTFSLSKLCSADKSPINCVTGVQGREFRLTFTWFACGLHISTWRKD